MALHGQNMAKTPFLVQDSKPSQELGPTQLHCSVFCSTCSWLHYFKLQYVCFRNHLIQAPFWIKQWSLAIQAKGIWLQEQGKIFANFTFKQCLKCCTDCLDSRQESTLNAENSRNWASHKSLLQQLSKAIGRFVSTATYMYVVCATILYMHMSSEFHIRGLHRYVHIALSHRHKRCSFQCNLQPSHIT